MQAKGELYTSEKPKILIVDDEFSVRKSLQESLSKDFFVTVSSCGKDAEALWQKDVFDIILLDIILPDSNGINLLKKIKRDFPETNVIMITAARQIKTAVNAMKLGAFDYISKPFDQQELRAVIDKSLQIQNRQYEAVKLLKRAQDEMLFGAIVGRSRKMIDVFKKIAQVMYTGSTVLIQGETGTGKELVARAIHFQGIRREHPFIPVHIGSLSSTLLESELFGYEKGAFTGAVSKKQGQIEIADKGTLFLDEIADIPLSAQVKLLRVLQEREFMRIGGTRDIKVDVRFIAATNEDLYGLVKKGKFREDLYYRINVVPIILPPLRERSEDIPLLLYHFIDKVKKKISVKVKGFKSEVVELLKRYNWPGNVREMENLIEHLALTTDGLWIGLEDLPAYIQKPEGSLLENNISSYERKIIEDALTKTNWVISDAAMLLGITRRVLRYRMDKLGINAQVNTARLSG